MPTQAHVEGLKELDRLLKQLPDKVHNRVMRSATLAGIKGAVKLAKGNAPVDPYNDGGTLKRSMTSKLNKSRTKGIIVASAGPKKEAKHPTLGTYAAYYGKVVEYGWRLRGQGAASRPPDPFMRLSLAEHAPHVLTDMQKNIGKKIEKEAAKLAKQ